MNAFPLLTSTSQDKEDFSYNNRNNSWKPWFVSRLNIDNIIFVAFYPSIARGKKITKIMVPMLKLDTNSGFHELFLNSNMISFIWLY
jgi:hypothetical protein